MRLEYNRIVLSLLGVIVGLMLVGVVSHTPLRHFIQVSPSFVALAVIGWRRDYARSAAMPIFLLWTFIMVLIWLFLLGLAHVLTGTFSPMERILTVVIGASGLLGVVACARASREKVRWREVAVFIVFGVLQAAAIWASLRPGVSRR